MMSQTWQSLRHMIVFCTMETLLRIGKHVTQQALEGIRILDLTRILVGPFCTMMLADMGADVIKVEHPVSGDDTRHWGPPFIGDRQDLMSAYFLSINRNKRSITINLKEPAGQAIIRQLAAQSHILIENFKVGQMDSFGLGYDDLKAINPALIYCSITGFGQDGEYANRPGYDFVVQAMSGLMSITGEPEGDPQKVGVATSDIMAGLFACQAILGALRHCERTGEGQFIDVALLDTQIATLVNIASSYLVAGVTPHRVGNAHPTIVPYQTFRASDDLFVLAVGNDGQFRKMCSLIGREDLVRDERFAMNSGRVANRVELVHILSAIFREKPAKQWVNIFLDGGVPASEINTVAEALTDPHVLSRDMVRDMPLNQAESIHYVAPPVKMSATPPQVYAPPPNLGEHTDEILRDVLGLDHEQIANLRKNGVL